MTSNGIVLVTPDMLGQKPKTLIYSGVDAPDDYEIDRAELLEYVE